MDRIAFVGLDLAKNVSQAHGIASDGAVLVKRQLRRSQVLTFFTLGTVLGRDGGMRVRPPLSARVG